MNHISSQEDFSNAADILPFCKDFNFRYHIVSQPLLPSIPMRLTLNNGIVIKAEIPNTEDGCLTADFSFYQIVVNDRSKNSWPEISKQEFDMQLALYTQIVTSKPSLGTHGLNIVD